LSQLTDFFESVGVVVLPLLRTSSFGLTLPRQRARVVEQCCPIGFTTLPIVAIISFFIGTVMALEADYSMEGFAAKEFVGSLFGLSMAWELGPMVTSVLWPAGSARQSPLSWPR
jgi:phospholipid/cholesterol/gamma-HCH transport system permease protein